MENFVTICGSMRLHARADVQAADYDTSREGSYCPPSGTLTYEYVFLTYLAIQQGCRLSLGNRKASACVKCHVTTLVYIRNCLLCFLCALFVIN